MTTATLDTLQLADEFIKAGFEEKKARVLAKKFGNLTNKHLVTKDYFKSELEKLELRLIIKLTVAIAAVVGFFRVMEAFF